MRYYFQMKDIIHDDDIKAFHMPTFCKASFGSILACHKVPKLNKILLKNLYSFQNLFLHASPN